MAGFDSDGFDQDGFDSDGFDFGEGTNVEVLLAGAAISSLAGAVGLAGDVVSEDVGEQPSGGYGAANAYNAHLQRKKRRERERQRILREIREIKDATDREIAELMHKQEAEEARKAELRSLVTEIEFDAADFSGRVAAAYMRAASKGTFSALEAFERELERAMEEEEFLLIAMLL